MNDMTHKYTNSLINETSPYLLQHANNPVNWYAWNEETLEKAKREDKLILVSIGYSACHWCHVMEQESFESEVVANIMNENFICIKVDREERPDVDQVYMDAVQMISGRGGWPLNCFALPDGKPFWGGTYFQKDQWIGILTNINQLFLTQKEKLIEQAESTLQGINNNDFIDLEIKSSEFTEQTIEDMIHNFSGRFDHSEGGTKGAPKFPMPNNVLFLLRYYSITKKKEILNHVELTLEKMASGGIYDQIGGGFARYSVDDHWHVPHFEKMLYDNAQLISLYAEAYQLTQNETYKQVIKETLEFIDREMTPPEGGFYSALDADSEGIEGKFYVWQKDEIISTLGEDSDIIMESFGIDQNAYWEDGNNVLIKAKSINQLSIENNITESEIHAILKDAKEALLNKRSKRIRPDLDDNILTPWNALMIKAYIDAYKAIGEPSFIEAAIRHTNFTLNNLKKQDGGLYHNHKNGKSTINGFLEDYAFVIEALIALYQSTFEENWIVQAKQLMDYAMDHFYSKKTGMFYFTSDESKDLITRKTEIMDNVIPASSSSIAKSLFNLSLIYENDQYRNLAEKMLKQIEEKMIAYPSAFSNWGILYLNMVYPFYNVVVTGKEFELKANGINSNYFPNTIIAGSNNNSNLPIFKDRFIEGKTMIYVCTGNECKLPVETAEDALNQINQ